METSITVLDRLMVINLEVHIWSASRKLEPQDLGDTELPPEELASLGSKKVCNPEELNIFKTLKARAESLLRQSGIRFLSGWAIPDEKLADVDAALAAIRGDFNMAKSDFLKRYEIAVQEWINNHPEWSAIIADSVVSEDYVRSRLDFRWQAFRIARAEEAGLMDQLDEEVQGLGATLYGEIARVASDTWKNCYEGKTEVTRKALSPLKSIRDKLFGLTFVEPTVSPIASLIDTALSNIPPRGPITGATLLMLQGLVALLRMPEEIVAHGQKILDGQAPSGILENLVMQNSPISNDRNELAPMSNVTVPALESCGLW